MAEEKQFDRLHQLDTERYILNQQHGSNNNYSNSSQLSLSPHSTSRILRNSDKKYMGELSLTTNPSYALYNSPIRSATLLQQQQQQQQHQQQLLLQSQSPTMTTSLILPSKSNIYTRLPIRDYSKGSNHFYTTSPTNSFKESLLNSAILMKRTSPSSSPPPQCASTSSLYGVRMPLLTTNYTEISNGDVKT